MKGIVLILVIFGIAVLPYILRRVLRRGMDKAEDAIRNRRIDRERMEGKTNTVESLADRYNQGGSSVNISGSTNDLSEDEKFCAFCGKKIPANAEFCSYCGKNISGT